MSAPVLLDSERFFQERYGYSTLDDIVGCLVDREVADREEINRAIEAYGPDDVWNDFVGPMLDEIENRVIP